MQGVQFNFGFTAWHNVAGLSLATFGLSPPILVPAQSLPDLGILANSARLLRQTDRHPQLTATTHHSTRYGFDLIVRVLLSGLLLLTAGPGAAAGVQLCLGEGGHIELEVRGTCGVQLAASHQAPLVSLSESEADDCKPCVDIILGARSAYKVETLPSSPSYTAGVRASLPGFSVSIPIFSPTQQCFTASLPDPAAAHTPLAAIRTVVLLT